MKQAMKPMEKCEGATADEAGRESAGEIFAPRMSAGRQTDTEKPAIASNPLGNSRRATAPGDKLRGCGAAGQGTVSGRYRAGSLSRTGRLPAIVKRHRTRRNKG